MIKKHTHCRLCNGKFESVLNLGDLYPSNFINQNEKSEDYVKYPLHLVRCKVCDLVQLEHTVDLDSMYREYWYKSGLNPTMVKDLEDIVVNVKKRVNLEETKDYILDIGSNDGTLLKLFGTLYYRVGIDPARNIYSIRDNRMEVFINDFFNLQVLEEAFNGKSLKNKFKVITSIAMFYDLEEPHEFVANMKYLLHQDGVWVIQFTDLISMLKANAFDNICHEHLEYYSLEVLKRLLESYELEIFDVQYNKVNGGSLRAFVGHRGRRPISGEIQKFIILERSYLGSDDVFERFRCGIDRIRDELTNFLSEEVLGKEDRANIYILGASTKGNTLLQYFGINNSLVDYAMEVNSDKFGKKTLGSEISIISEDQGLKDQPDYIIVLPWHFKDYIDTKLQDYKTKGGVVIYPLPSLMFTV